MRRVMISSLIILAILVMACLPAFFVAGPVHAAPFLVCDPQANVESYEISTDNGVTWQDVGAEDLGDGNHRLKYDLGPYAEGAHNVQVRAKNIWGVSAAVPFDFTKALPVSPASLGFSP